MSPLDLAHRHRLDVAAKTPAESGEIIDRIHTGDAVDQALEGGVIDLIGTAEAMDDPGFSSFCGGVPDRLGEGVVGDG